MPMRRAAETSVSGCELVFFGTRAWHAAAHIGLVQTTRFDPHSAVNMPQPIAHQHFPVTTGPPAARAVPSGAMSNASASAPAPKRRRSMMVDPVL